MPRFRPVPLNPPLSPAARARVEAALAQSAGYARFPRHSWAPAEDAQRLHEVRMACIDALPAALRARIHERGGAGKVLARYQRKLGKLWTNYVFAVRMTKLHMIPGADAPKQEPTL